MSGIRIYDKDGLIRFSIPPIPSSGEGPQGPQGNQGLMGPQGNQGSRGFQGYQGSIGPQGNQGDQGTTGIGTQGNQGYQGNQGDQGNQGNQGYQGYQGPQGNQGNQGNQGSQGTPYFTRVGTILSTTTAGDSLVVGLTSTDGVFESSNGTRNVVPTMTSATSPAPFVISASTESSSSYAAWKAFDRTVSWFSGWMANNVQTGWLKVDLGTATKIYSYKITASASAQTYGVDPKSWTFEGSATGSFAGEQTTLDTQTNVSTWTNGEVRTYTLSSPQTYRYFRLNISANQGYTWLGVTELQLIGDSKGIYVGTDNRVGINAYQLASDSVLTVGANALVIDTGNRSIFGGLSRLGAGGSKDIVQVWGNIGLGNPTVGGAAYLYFYTYPTLQAAESYIKIQNYQWTFALTMGLGDGYTDLFKMDASGGFAHTSAQPIGRIFNFTSKVNNSGTAGYQGIVLNITETAVGTGANLLLDLQTTNSSVVTSRANVDNTGMGYFGGGVKVGSTNSFYFGDTATDGTWRIVRSGVNLEIQHRESGNYVTKTIITP